MNKTLEEFSSFCEHSEPMCAKCEAEMEEMYKYYYPEYEDEDECTGDLN